MNKKKIFIIVLILFVLASGGLVVYNFVFKNAAPPVKEEPNPSGESLNLSISLISQKKAFALAIGQDKQTIKYYTKNNGHVFESNFDGSGAISLSGADLLGLEGILWSPDGKKVIAFYENPGNLKKVVFDYETKKTVTLNENIKSVAWSPSSNKIVYQFETSDGQSNNISVANANGSNWRNILQTRLLNLQISWPVPNKIYALPSPSSQTEGFIFAIDPTSDASNKILSGVWGLEAKWSPDGQKFIYSASDNQGKNLKLYVASSDGSQPEELPVTTLAEKCIWSSDSQNIFCAVPQEISKSAVWPDDYLAGKTIVKDDFYMVDTSILKGIKIAQSDGEGSFDAGELLLSPSENYLFFINKSDGFLYNIEIKLK